MTAQPGDRVSVDVAIVGGGIAGLFILDRLRRQGVDVLLIDGGTGQVTVSHASQTLASQGILHRGVKYALRPGGADQAQRFADLAARWSDCLDGRPRPGDPNLGGTRILSPGVWLRSAETLHADLVSRLEAARLRGLAERNGERYRLLETVVDVPDLVRRLTAPHRESIVEAAVVGAEIVGEEVCLRMAARESTPGRTAGLESGTALHINCRHLVLAAGAGNEELLRSLGFEDPGMRRGPLQMTWIEGADLPPVWCHVLEDSAAPGRPGAHFTVTSHPVYTSLDRSAVHGQIDALTRAGASPAPTAGTPPIRDQRRSGGDSSKSDRSEDAGHRWAWYVGGDPSEIGADWPPERLTSHVRALLGRHFPDVYLSAARFRTTHIDRAEPAGPRRLEPFVHRQGRVFTVWPMKLALAPLAADALMAQLTESLERV